MCGPVAQDQKSTGGWKLQLKMKDVYAKIQYIFPLLATSEPRISISTGLLGLQELADWQRRHSPEAYTYTNLTIKPDQDAVCDSSVILESAKC